MFPEISSVELTMDRIWALDFIILIYPKQDFILRVVCKNSLPLLGLP